MNKIISDFDAFSSVFFMPSFSILSLVFRIPAVSINLKLYPLIVSLSSMASLVVPGISETIAFSSFKRVFNNVDLPAFGSPIIDTGIPSLITLPNLNELTNCVILSFISNNNFLNSFLSANSTSSSEKSSSNSIKEAKSINFCLKMFNSFEKPPFR